MGLGRYPFFWIVVFWGPKWGPCGYGNHYISPHIVTSGPDQHRVHRKISAKLLEGWQLELLEAEECFKPATVNFKLAVAVRLCNIHLGFRVKV